MSGGSRDKIMHSVVLYTEANACLQRIDSRYTEGEARVSLIYSIWTKSFSFEFLALAPIAPSWEKRPKLVFFSKFGDNDECVRRHDIDQAATSALLKQCARPRAPATPTVR